LYVLYRRNSHRTSGNSLQLLSIYSIASLISNRQRFKKHTMALNTLDPQTAPIIIDLQMGIVSLPFVHPGSRNLLQVYF
jgi:hypothetical protein